VEVFSNSVEAIGSSRGFIEDISQSRGEDRPGDVGMIKAREYALCELQAIVSSFLQNGGKTIEVVLLQRCDTTEFRA